MDEEVNFPEEILERLPEEFEIDDEEFPLEDNYDEEVTE